MKTAIQCPTVEQLQALPDSLLEQMAQVAELAIAKPYLLDRIRTALFLKEAP